MILKHETKMNLELRRSKMKTIIIFVSVFFMLTSQAQMCLTLDMRGALFVVDEVEGQVIQIPSASEDTFNIQLMFSACVKNLQEQPMSHFPIAIHTFRSERKPDKVIKNTVCENVDWGCIPTTTDSRGCIKWVEPYSFSLSGEPRWFPFKRVISYQDVNRVILMGINPWIAEVVDTRGISDSLFFAFRNFFMDSQELEVQRCIEERSLEEVIKYGDAIEIKEISKRAYVK